MGSAAAFILHLYALTPASSPFLSLWAPACRWPHSSTPLCLTLCCSYPVAFPFTHALPVLIRVFLWGAMLA